MDITKFTSDSPGELIKLQKHDDFCFIPAPLPEEFQLDPSLTSLWVEAREAIGELRGISQTLPEPSLLIRPLGQREALKSSSLEGTYAKPEELLAYEVKDFEEPLSSKSDVREVFNYQLAMELGTSLISQEYPFSEWLIRQMHERLLSGVRGQEKSPGEIRTTQVHIGAGRRFNPAPSEHLTSLLGALEKSMQSQTKIDPLIWALMVHYQFETIHPFRDGNGRVGRLLLALMISKGCGFDMPWLYLSPYFDRYKDDYIDALFNVSARNDFNSWIKLGLQATVQTSKETILRIKDLLGLKSKYEELIRDYNGRDRLMHILPRLFSIPMVNYKTVQLVCDVSYVTARKDVEVLEELGIVRHYYRSSNPKFFLAPEIMDIIHAED